MTAEAQILIMMGGKGNSKSTEEGKLANYRSLILLWGKYNLKLTYVQRGLISISRDFTKYI